MPVIGEGMNDLRWILIVAGAILLVGIYLWGRRGSKQDESVGTIVRSRPDPSVEPQPYERASPEPAGDPAIADEPAQSNDRQPPPRVEARPAVSPRFDEPAVRRGRVEPTFSELDSPPSTHAADDSGPEADPVVTAELPVRESTPAPTLGMSSTPSPRRIERRKIVALRLAAPQRYAGDELRQALEGESLQHGRYDVFHRLNDDGASVFAVASMVEPGTFDLEHMAAQKYPGVTMFAQLPGPVPGVHALHDLVACGKRLQEILGGTLQDERGVPLTVHRIERLRQEIVEFERGHARDMSQRPMDRPSA